MTGESPRECSRVSPSTQSQNQRCMHGAFGAKADKPTLRRTTAVASTSGEAKSVQGSSHESGQLPTCTLTTVYEGDGLAFQEARDVLKEMRMKRSFLFSRWKHQKKEWS